MINISRTMSCFCFYTALLCDFIARLSLHYMMFPSIQTICFLWGYDPGNMSVSLFSYDDHHIIIADKTKQILYFLKVGDSWLSNMIIDISIPIPIPDIALSGANGATTSSRCYFPMNKMCVRKLYSEQKVWEKRPQLPSGSLARFSCLLFSSVFSSFAAGGGLLIADCMLTYNK